MYGLNVRSERPTQVLLLALITSRHISVSFFPDSYYKNIQFLPDYTLHPLSTVFVKKVLDLYVLGSSRYAREDFGVPYVCVRTCASLGPERLNGFSPYSEFESLSIIDRYTANINILAAKLGHFKGSTKT